MVRQVITAFMLPLVAVVVQLNLDTKLRALQKPEMADKVCFLILWELRSFRAQVVVVLLLMVRMAGLAAMVQAMEILLLVTLIAERMPAPNKVAAAAVPLVKAMAALAVLVL